MVRVRIEGDSHEEIAQAANRMGVELRHVYESQDKDLKSPWFGIGYLPPVLAPAELNYFDHR